MSLLTNKLIKLVLEIRVTHMRAHALISTPTQQWYNCNMLFEPNEKQ